MILTFVGHMKIVQIGSRIQDPMDKTSHFFGLASFIIVLNKINQISLEFYFY